MKKSFVLFVFFVQFFLTSCYPQLQTDIETGWRYQGLRLIDPSDVTAASADIVAVYLRQRITSSGRDGFQARLDMMEVDIRPGFDLYLAIDDQPTKGMQDLPSGDRADINWDRLVKMGANGEIIVFDEHFNQLYDVSLSVLRDTFLDTISIDYHENGLKGLPVYFQLQVFTADNRSDRILDRTAPVTIAGTPPKPVNVLFAFWDSFPAYTSIQALRRWDGAHTGPLGGRHGLANLLRTFDSHGVPLVLLDLKNPASLAALDYGGDLDLVRSMVRDGFLILPDGTPVSPGVKPLALPPWFLEDWLARSDELSFALDLPYSPYLFQNQNLVILQDPNKRIQLLVDQDTLQPQPSGPSLAMRRHLANTASEQKSPHPLLVLGGDLPDSTWGDPQIARVSLQYLKNRPWIHFLDQNQVATFPGGGLRTNQDRRPISIGSEITPLRRDQEDLFYEVNNLPESPVKEAAWQLIISTISPAYPQSPELMALRTNYWFALNDLIDASRWAEKPDIEANCPFRGSENGPPKCILTSYSWYLSFDAEHACIRYGFIQLEDGLHQIFAPEYQLINGQSDPSFWDLSLGLRADPTIFACAFDDSGHNYQGVTGMHQILFEDKGSGVRKSFRISENNLFVTVNSDQPLEVSIPLALDPWNIYTPGWAGRYKDLSSGNQWVWSLNPVFRVETGSDSNIQTATFKDSQQRMGAVEDPNVEKSPGDYLPFPVAQATIMIGSSTTISLSILEEFDPIGFR